MTTLRHWSIAPVCLVAGGVLLFLVLRDRIPDIHAALAGLLIAAGLSRGYDLIEEWLSN